MRALAIAIGTGCLLAATALALAIGDGDAGDGLAPEGAAPASAGLNANIEGLEEKLAPSELATRSDLVVRGVAVGEKVKPFSQNPEVPGWARRQEPGFYRHAYYRETTIRVEERYRGDGDRLLAIRTYADPPNGSGYKVGGHGAPELSVGNEYVLFLFKGTGFWQGSYLVLGEQGFARVAGGAASFASGKTMRLAALRSAVAGS